MRDVFYAMVLEEWRIHSLLMGNRSFSFFPLVVAVLSFVASLMAPLFGLFLTGADMAGVLHIVYVFFGLSVGGFGLLGREVLNRRLGDVSLVAYSSRSLPVSERHVFFVFVVKDVFFYLLFLVAPFLAGFSPARVVLGLSLAKLPVLCLSLSLAFLFGLGVSFLLSTLYAVFGRLVLAVLAFVAAAFFLYGGGFSPGLLPALAFYLKPSVGGFLVSVFAAFFPSLASFAFFTFDYHSSARRFKPEFTGLCSHLMFTGHGVFLAKDFLDLKRSSGGLGKVFFSYLFPLAAVALLMGFFSRLLPVEGYHFMLIMSLMTGVISTNLYSWLAEYDFVKAYEFLPIPRQYIIESKLILHGCFASLASFLAVFLSFLYLRPPVLFLFLGLLFALSVGAYVTSATMYFTGLKPNVLLYSGGVFLRFGAATMVPLLVPSILFMTGLTSEIVSAAVAAAYCLTLTAAAFKFTKKGLRKWR